MTQKLKLVFVGFLALHVSGQQVSMRPVEVTTTERVALASGGLIRIDGSFGLLDVEGWDQPDVEITVIKSTNRFYQDAPPQEATSDLENVQVTAKRQSDAELVISTSLSPRHGHFPMSSAARTGVTVEYRIRAPRASRLVVHHRGGHVQVGNMLGDVEATNPNGDIVLFLPEKGPYSIDARAKIGPVASDFTGSSHARYLVGQRFSNGSPAGARRIFLRMGLGGITIKAFPPEAEPPAT